MFANSEEEKELQSPSLEQSYSLTTPAVEGRVADSKHGPRISMITPPQPGLFATPPPIHRLLKRAVRKTRRLRSRSTKHHSTIDSEKTNASSSATDSKPSSATTISSAWSEDSADSPFQKLCVSTNTDSWQRTINTSFDEDDYGVPLRQPVETIIFASTHDEPPHDAGIVVNAEDENQTGSRGEVLFDKKVPDKPNTPVVEPLGWTDALASNNNNSQTIRRYNYPEALWDGSAWKIPGGLESLWTMYAEASSMDLADQAIEDQWLPTKDNDDTSEVCNFHMSELQEVLDMKDFVQKVWNTEVEAND